MNVYDRILQTRPNTFITFGPTGPIESGHGPLPFTAQGLSYSYGHMLPGGSSWYAYGAGALSFDGRLCRSPDNGGTASVEAVISIDEFAVDSAVPVLSLSNILSLSRVTNSVNMGTRYVMTPDHGTPVILEVDSSPSVDNVTINVNGLNVTLIVNGVSVSTVLDSGLYQQDCNHASITPGLSGRLWGVAIRPVSVNKSYSTEVYNLMTSFSLPEEAEESLSPTTFVFDRDNLNYEELMRLEDVAFDSSPERAYLYNGSELPQMDVEETIGYLNLPSFEDVHNVLFDTRGLWATLGGDLTEGTVGMPYTPNVFPVYPLNKEVNGEPEELHLFYDTDGLLGGEPISLNLYLMPETVTMNSPSMPNRVVELSAGSVFVGDNDLRLFGGGLVGEATVLPDLENEDVLEYPQAYGMWVYINSAGNIASCSSFDVSVDSSMSIVATGAGSVYVNGSQYTSGVVTNGWNFISFIPASQSNEPVVVGDLSSTNIIYTFSEYYVTSPTDYISSVYELYVDPPVIKGSEISNVIIGDVESRVYAHDWSISSAD